MEIGKIVAGSLTILIIALGIIYVSFEDYKIRVDNDKSTFYFKGRVLGREYNSLLDGTTKLYRDVSNIEVIQYQENNLFKITRKTPYKRGPTIIDTWTFIKNTTNVIQFPISHKIEVLNGQGYYYKYTVKNLLYSGDTFKLDGKQTSMNFDKNMKVEWWEGYRLGWIYKTGSMYVKSEKITKDYVSFYARLFDPPTTLTVESYATDISVELGSIIAVSADGSDTICIDVNHTDYGVNYTCGNPATGPITFNLNLTHFILPDYTSNTTGFSYILDNRSDLINVTVNISSTGETYDIEFGYYGQTKSITGNLTGEYLKDINFTYNSVEGITADLEYVDTSLKTISYDLPDNPKQISFQIWSQTSDLNNYFLFNDYFNTSNNITNATTRADFPLWVWDDFSSDSRTDLYESGTGTYNIDVNTTSQQIEGDSYSTKTCTSADSVEYSDSDNFKFQTLEENISKYKMIEFNYSCFASSSASNPSGCGTPAQSSGTAVCRVLITNSETVASYIELVSARVAAVASASSGDNVGDSDSASSTVRLERIEDTCDTFRFMVYIDGVYQETTNSISGDVNLGVLGQTSASCKNVACGGCSNCPSGTGSITSMTYDMIKYSGIGNNYTNDGTYQNDSYVTSNLITTTTDNIHAAKITANEYEPSGCSISYLLSNDNGVNWESVLNNQRHTFTTTDNDLRWKANLNCTGDDLAAILDVELSIINSSSENISADFRCNGTNEFSFIAKLNETNSPRNVSVDISSWDISDDLSVCIYNNASGILVINTSILNSSLNPVSLNHTALETCNPCHVNVSYSGSNIAVDALAVAYLGGNKTYEVLAHNDDYSTNISRVLTYYYSDWNYDFPNYIDYLEFIPRTPTSDNVVPYGQTNNRPILNVTMKNYGGEANYSMQLNESYSCVNLTVNSNSTKSYGQLLGNSTWYDIATSKVVDDNFGIWMWADLQCNYTAWRTWQPLFSFKACCSDCVVCD